MEDLNNKYFLVERREF